MKFLNTIYLYFGGSYMKEQILSRAKELQPELLNLRRDLHRHPEIAW